MKKNFRVYDKVAERYVAQATLHPNAPTEYYDAFIREARFTGLLQHPNIMSVHDLGTDEKGFPYFIMELKLGGSLQDILKKQGNAKVVIPVTDSTKISTEFSNTQISIYPRILDSH